MVTRDTTHLAGGLPAEPVDRPARWPSYETSGVS
jgi:hypothetical protein